MPCLTVGDNAFERGLAHGKTFAADVAANLETYLRRFEAKMPNTQKKCLVWPKVPSKVWPPLPC